MFVMLISEIGNTVQSVDSSTMQHSLFLPQTFYYILILYIPFESNMLFCQLLAVSCQLSS